jgi:hypothetical protein
MHADIGHGVEPGLDGGGEQTAIGAGEPGQTVLVDGADALFDSAFCVPLADMTRHEAKAGMLRQRRLLGMEPWRFAPRAPADGRVHMLAHDAVGHPAAHRKGVGMAGEAVGPGLRHGALDRQQATRAQHQDTDPQASAGGSHPHRSASAPVDLRPFPGGQGPCETGRRGPGSHRAPISFDGGGGARTALLTPALPDLGGPIGIRLAPRAQLGLARLEWTRARRPRARAQALLAQPRGHGLGIEAPDAGELGRLAAVPPLQGRELTQLRLLPHDHPCPLCAHPAGRATRSSCGSRSGAAAGGCGSQAHTGERGRREASRRWVSRACRAWASGAADLEKR